VLSAEIRSATPDEQMMAVARIVAAQLSAIVAPVEAARTAQVDPAVDEAAAVRANGATS
jgi:hypothetical protein